MFALAGGDAPERELERREPTRVAGHFVARGSEILGSKASGQKLQWHVGQPQLADHRAATSAAMARKNP